MLIVLLCFLFSISILANAESRFNEKYELKGRRDAFSNHYVNEDGSITAKISSKPINYKKNGKWQTIDTNFKAQRGVDHDFVVTENVFQLMFSKVSNKPQKIAIGEDWISFQPLNGRNIQGEFINNRAYYMDVWENADLEYISESDQLKENIILKSRKHPAEFSFKMNLHGLKVVKTDTGSVMFADKNGDIAAIIPPGFMEDAAGDISTEIIIEVEEQGTNIILTLIPNKEWLEAEERAYPVRVDPTVIIYAASGNLVDAHVTSYHPNSNYGGTSRLELGMNKPFFSSWVLQYSYLKFDVSSIPVDANITKAVASMALYDERCDPAVNISTRKVLSYWSESGIKWSNRPSVSSIYSTESVDNVGYYDFFLSPQWVEDWIKDPNTNYGFALTCSYKEVGSLKYFYSSEASNNKPTLYVIYEAGAGLESYWKYRTFDLGSAGSASINVGTLNLLFQHVDVSIPAPGFNLGVTRYYNSCKDLIDIGFGYGWSIGAYSYLRVSTDGKYVTLIQGDGSEHIFQRSVSSSVTYLAPDGIDLSMRLSGDKYIFKSADKVEYSYSVSTKKLLEKKDDRGRKIIYSYDASGRLIKITDSAFYHRSIILNYANGRLSSIEDPKGRRAYYYYDGAGNLASYEDFDGHITKYNYSGHNLIQITDAMNNRTGFEYTEEDIFSVTTADQTGLASPKRTYIRKYGIIEEKYRTLLTEVNGQETTFTNLHSGIVEKVEIEGETPDKTTVYNYTYERRRVKIVDNGRTKTYYDYEYKYDNIPNLVEVIRDYGRLNYSTKFVYDSYHNVISATDSKGNITKFNWSSDGKSLDSMEDAEGNITHYTYYESNGNIKTVKVSPTVGEYVTTEYTYDDYGYPKSIKYPINKFDEANIYAETHVEYDILGNLIAKTDANGVKINYTYDNCNLLTDVSNPNYPTDTSKWVKYQYDNNHRLQYIYYTNQAGRNHIQYTYTPLNHIKDIIYPDGTEDNYIYDSCGRLSQVKYSNGDWVKYEYDIKNQLVKTSYSDSKVVTYAYDKYGNRTEMRDERGLVTYTYDNLNRLSKESEPGTTTAYTEYWYDSENNIEHIKPPKIDMASYTYDKVNNVKTVDDDSYVGGETTYHYNGLNQVTKVIYPNGTGEYYTYDKAGRVRKIDYGGSIAYEYDYYPNGNLKQTVKTSSTENYTIDYDYDALDQLIKYEQKDTSGLVKKVEEFEYDPMGNRITSTKNGILSEYTYDVHNKLTQLKNQGAYGTQNYAYDGRGNMKTTNQGKNLSFNAQGLLESVSWSGGSASFKYDGGGRRYSQVLNGETINYHLDIGWQTLYETDGTGNVKREFINGLKTIAVKEGSETKYNYHDQLGSTVYMRNDTTTEEYAYEPFGCSDLVIDDFCYNDSPLYHDWKVYSDSSYTGTVSHEVDPDSQNGYMSVQSDDGTYFAISYGDLNNIKINKNIVSFKYRTSQRMKFYVRVGSKYLEYNFGLAGEPYVTQSGIYYIIPMGTQTMDGNWRYFERDVEKDLKEGFGLDFEFINRFCIRGGEYSLDDLWVMGQDTSGNTRKFTDEDEDTTGLYYLRARYYDPTIGRFISQDSYRGNLFDPLSLNRYIYCKNNPLKYVDPSGHMANFSGVTSDKASDTITYSEIEYDFFKVENQNDARLRNNGNKYSANGKGLIAGVLSTSVTQFIKKKLLKYGLPLLVFYLVENAEINNTIPYSPGDMVFIFNMKTTTVYCDTGYTVIEEVGTNTYISNDKSDIIGGTYIQSKIINHEVGGLYGTKILNHYYPGF